jgi:hypothetical protein
MPSVRATDVLDALLKLGVQVKLLENFDLDISPASKLLPLHRQMLKSEKMTIVIHLSRLAAKEMNLTKDEVRSTFHFYHSHHFKCDLCIAAGKRYRIRCAEGRSLWFRYQLQSYR